MTQEIPERLKEARKTLNLNQIQIAKDLNIQQKSISDIENGKIVNIPNTYIYYFYRKGVSLEWIYEGKGSLFVNENIELQKKQKQVPLEGIFAEINKLQENSAKPDEIESLKTNEPLSRDCLFERIIESKDFSIKSLFAYIKSLENNLEYLKELLDKSISNIISNKK